MQNRVKIGEIVNTFGLKGELKIYPYGNEIENVDSFFIKDKNYKIEKIRKQKNVYIVKLKNIDDIDNAEKFKNIEIEVNKDDLPDGTYYIEDLIGMEVFDDTGKYLGKLDDIFNTGANDIYQVGKILLPAIDDVIKKIDIENNKITVHILKGLID